MYKRLLHLPAHPENSFFLWGPRQTGKTTLLKATYPKAMRIDLLKTDELMRYTQEPSLLRQEVLTLDPGRMVVVDEIQKVPSLLDEIHYLIQEENRIFALCGSSARKIRRSSKINLLGGRALRFELLGLTARELGDDFSLERMLNAGPLPHHYISKNCKALLRAYVQDYLREEVMEEGLTRSLPVFSDFLRVAAIGDTEVVNMTNIARETGMAVSTVRGHFSILEDTLMGAFLPSFTLRPKRRTIQAPKFYFRDLGVVNHLTRRIPIRPGSELFGKAFENWLFHELSAHSRYTEMHYDLSFWRLSSGIEVDFILGPGSVAIEGKGKPRITSSDLKGLLHFKKEYPSVEHLIVVCLDPRRRKTEEGIHILPYKDFIESLWAGQWTDSLN